jgi:hypothetical protein
LLSLVWGQGGHGEFSKPLIILMCKLATALMLAELFAFKVPSLSEVGTNVPSLGNTEMFNQNQH